MNGVKILCFLLILPALAAVGHDAWLYYHVTFEEGKDLGVQISDLGYLWVNYARESHDWALQNMDPVVWEGFIKPMLLSPAVLVLLAPALAVYALLGLLWLFGLWPFAAAGKVKSQFSALGRGGKKGGKLQYKRK